MNSHIPFDANNDWTLDPYHCNQSNDPLVDKVIGNAYAVVRAVYCNLGNLKLLYDFLNTYGMVLGVKSEAELKKLNKLAKYARIYSYASTGDRQVTDYLYVPDDTSGIRPDDPTATGSWIKVATSETGGGGEGGGQGAYIPYVYANGSALGGETSFKVPDGTIGVPFLIINGSVQYIGFGFTYSAATATVTLSNPLVQGDEVIALTTAIPANPDNPEVPGWVQVNWLYNNGSAVGGEQVITVPYNFQDVPAVYKNGLRLYKGLQSNSYVIDPDTHTITMTEILAQGDRVIVTLGGESETLTVTDRTLQEVARANDVKDSDVVFSTSTNVVITGKKILYDVASQKSWALPDLPPNAYIVKVEGNQLTYNPGNVTVSLLSTYQRANTRELWKRSLAQLGLNLVDGSFEEGATLTSKSDALWHIEGAQCYVWLGSLPKTVSKNSTPANSGGIGNTAWAIAKTQGSNASVSFYQFGAVGDGVANDTHAIKLAFDYALANNVAVEQHSGVFLLDGTEYIDIKNLQTDFTGCTLKPAATYKGQIVITQPDTPVTYSTGSDVVTKLNANSAASRAVGSTILSGIVSDTALDGCYIKLSTSQQMFTFRDTIYTRKDLNRVYNRGNIENPLRYGLGTNVTEVVALKIRKDVQTVKGLTIDESLSKNYRIVYINNASRVKLINTSFINAPKTQDFSDSRLEIAGSYDVMIDGLFTPSVVDSFNGTGDIYSYSLGISESMNVNVKRMTANGEGWGATGSNNSANITFEECDLSRIDFHMPFQGYLRAKKCNVGRYGVVVTGVGDLILDDIVFNGSTDQLGSIIATRPDCGGFFDGDLYMNNVTIAGRRSGQISALIQGPSDAGQGPTTNSPIASTLFNKIVIRDLKLRDGFFEQTFATLLLCGRDSQLLFPKVVDIDGMNFGGLPKSSGVGLNIDFSRFKALFSDMTDSEHPVSGRKTTDIILNNIQSPYLSITSASWRHNPSVVAGNVRHVLGGETDTLLEINQRGKYLFNSCSFEQLKLFYGTNPNGLVTLTMRGGKLHQPVAATPPISGESKHSVVLDGVDIVCQFNGQDSTFPITKAIIARALVQDCRYWDVSGARLYNLSFSKPDSTSATVSVPLKVGQKLSVASGYTAGNTYTRSNLTALWESGCKQVVGIGTAGNIIATYTASAEIVSQIVITSPTGNEIRDVSI